MDKITAMGPIALFDKSFLEGLNLHESVWFDHFFLANVCPMFYAETQSDLAKENSRRGTPEELVSRLADKFPEFSGSPNVRHATICTANLLGEEIPFRSQVILPPGCQTDVAGRRISILPHSREATAFLRWTQGRYLEEERKAAAEWRAHGTRCTTAQVIERLTKAGVYKKRPCGTLADVRATIDDVINRLSPMEQFSLACTLLGVSDDHEDHIIRRFTDLNQPPLSVFAPYADFCLRVELFFHLGVDSSRMSSAQRMDLCYLFYLPFCQFFVSNDWVHKQAAPLFLRDDQEFVAADDLKSALRELNDRYSALPESERAKSIHQIAPHPPMEGDNLVTHLWDRHWPTWREQQAAKTTTNLKPLIEAFNERAKNLDPGANVGDSKNVAIEELDAFVQRRTVRTKKGSWWLVPKELRHR